MKFIVIFIVFAFGDIQTNGVGVSKCYTCNPFEICHLPGSIEKCSTEEASVCITIAISQDGLGYIYAKGCVPNSPYYLEMCATTNQTDHGNNYCYTCNEELCNFQ